MLSDAELVALLLAEARLEREFYNTMGDVDPDQWEHAQAWTDAHEARCAAVLARLEAEGAGMTDLDTAGDDRVIC